MTEYKLGSFYKDKDGDVWAAVPRMAADPPETVVFYRYESGGLAESGDRRSLDHVEGNYGPVTECHGDGLPMGRVPASEVRALVAGALLDFATRMTDGWYRDGSSADSLRDQVVESARETAQAVLRGDVKPAVVSG